jgi:hypothetical protein
MLLPAQQGKKPGEYYTKTDNSYEVIDGEKEIVGQTTTTFQKPDDRVIRRLNRIYNYKNDPRITELTGLQRTDGLSDYTLDSTFYDKNGNDTLKVSYVSRKHQWVKTMKYHMHFRPDHQADYIKMEKLDEPWFTNQTFYKFNGSGKVFMETEYRCAEKKGCDSTYKEIFYYNPSQKIDSTIRFEWKDRKWQREVKRK